MGNIIDFIIDKYTDDDGDVGLFSMIKTPDAMEMFWTLNTMCSIFSKREKELMDAEENLTASQVQTALDAGYRVLEIGYDESTGEKYVVEVKEDE